MPVGPVDDQGNVIFFQDTGPPNDGAETYTTVVLIPGTGFRGSIFQRLFPLASQRNLRLIAINRRGFTGSSPISSEELSYLDVSNAISSAQYLRNRALGLAYFMGWLTEEYNIPPVSKDGALGGICILGWSLGALFCLILLGFVEDLPNDLVRKLEPYFRSVILLDPSGWMLGIPVPSGFIDFIRHPSLTAEERRAAFNTWVSGYFLHNSLTSRDHNDLEKSLPESRKHLSTLLRGDTQISKTIEADNEAGDVPRCDFLVRATPLPVFAERTRKALFNDALAEKYFPRLKVSLMWGEKTTCVAVSGVWNLLRLSEESKEKGIAGRPLSSVLMPGANHFPHWDQPEEMMDVLKSMLCV